jgi:hypothetical protein
MHNWEIGFYRAGDDRLREIGEAVPIVYVIGEVVSQAGEVEILLPMEKSAYEAFKKRVLELADRRERLSKLQSKCSQCGSDQMQLLPWKHDPATFRCRMCKAECVVSG